MRILVTVALALFLPALGDAAPVSVAGFTFAEGEAAFADDAFLASGSGVRFSCTAGGIEAGSLGQALSGSDLAQCVNVSGGGDGIVEVLFTDNSILNASGTDLVIFELSGEQPVGAADSKERFEVSVFDGSSFSPFFAFDPVATGFAMPESTLDVFAVQIDLSHFGIADDARVDRVRLHLFDNGQGTKGADIAALGAINSAAPVPEPAATPLVLFGLLVLGIRRGSSVLSSRCE